MAAELWINDGGVARKCKELWVNDAGTARQIQEIWVNDGGTARLIYQALTIFISNTVISRVDNGTPCEFHVNADGRLYQRIGPTLGDIGAWISNPAYVGLVECRATLTGGTFSSGTLGAWQSCATTRSWSVGAGASSFQTGTMTLEFRKSADAVVIGSASIRLECDRTGGGP